MERDLFGEMVVSGRPTGRARGWIWPASVAAHAAVVALLVTVPILVSEDIPAPSGAVRAFFLEPPALLAPPPPPPPLARADRRAVVLADANSAGLTTPISIPDEIPDEVAVDFGVEGGAPGGVEGGVAGGVVGGIVGGLHDLTPPVRARRVGGDITEPRKLREVAPAYPALARRARIQGVVVLDCTVDTRGRVTEVSVINGVSPLLEKAALEAVRQWVYTPTLVGGVPVPVQLKVTIAFNLRTSA